MFLNQAVCNHYSRVGLILSTNVQFSWNFVSCELAESWLCHAGTTVVTFYFIMADVSGKLRIWDTTQKEHLLKYEYQPFAGKIKDLAWTEDSKRIAVVGEGREKWVILLFVSLCISICLYVSSHSVNLCMPAKQVLYRQLLILWVR